MTITINGRAVRWSAGSTVADVVAALSAGPRGVAVAVNGAVVPRTAWAGTPLTDGDVVEVLTAVQGG
jgi:sulfur carrier protein